MNWWRPVNWLRGPLKRGQQERELDAELRFHFESAVADHVRGGMSDAEARREARLQFGGLEQVREECRDARGMRWVEDLWKDIGYALRTLRHNPGFAAVALLTLALGSGSSAVMFTLINGVLLRPLNYPQPERLVILHEQIENYGAAMFSYLNFLDCKRDSQTLAPMAAWRFGGGTVSEPGDPEYVTGRQVSAGLFSVLGVAPIEGRAFRANEDVPGAPPVALISERLWQRAFGGKPGAVGGRLVYNGKAYTIVGIAPTDLRLSGDADVFTPIGQNTDLTMQHREFHPGIRVLARLRPGATLLQAQSDLARIGRHLAEQYPKSNAGHSFAAEPLRDELVGSVGPSLWLLLGAVGLVQLIVCVNVASLMLARSVSRERELAMRVALGASRGRLVRQCLTESSLLALAGGALGLLIAILGTRPFVTFWPGSLPRAEEVRFDWHVFLFTGAASLLSGLLFGLAPALRAPVRDLEQTLRAGVRNVAGSSRRLHGFLVASEIALAVVVLVAAGMLGRTLLRLSSVDPGIDIRNMLVARVAQSPETIGDPAKTRATFQNILDRVRHVPGVEDVALTDIVPMTDSDDEVGSWSTPAAPPLDQMKMALLHLVTPDYLKTMRLPLRRGRYIDTHDRLGSEPVAVIDEVLARRAFAGKDAVGSRLFLQFLGPVRVVGVVGHVRHWGLDADDHAIVREQIYLPLVQLPDTLLRQVSPIMSLVIRSRVAPMSLAETVSGEVRGATRDQTMYDVRTMEQIFSATLARQRFLSLLFAIFAGLALLLASIGLYGVLAYLTSRRVPEIGVRRALGAGSGDVMRLIFRQSIGMILTGVGIGIVGAAAAARLMERLNAGVRPADPLTFGITILILLAAALLATWLPARRATRINPSEALRCE